MFRAVYKQDRKGNLLDKDGKIVAPTIREVQQGRPPEGHPPREGHALRRLPLPAGRPRRRQDLRRVPRRGRDRLRSTATARSAPGPRSRPAVRRRRRAAPISRSASPPWAGGASNGGERQADPALHAGRRSWSGRSPQVMDRSPPALRTTTSARASRRRSGSTARPGADVRRRRSTSRSGNDRMACFSCHTVVGHQLLRLPPAAAGEREGRQEALRGRRHPQLDLLQPAGDPHDIFMLGRHSTVKGNRDRAGALVRAP